ncbi:MAG: hypothetical protein IID33_17795 [Planctomycetes bacterium]|nr:hypothetical protein [Planctomycetota bacterium]
MGTLTEMLPMLLIWTPVVIDPVVEVSVWVRDLASIWAEVCEAEFADPVVVLQPCERPAVASPEILASANGLVENFTPTLTLPETVLDRDLPCDVDSAVVNDV